MPVYLLHGFRWPRASVRIHIILQNLDDAAAEWLVAPTTSATLLDNFRTLYPEQMAHLSSLRFIEQYDPFDETVKSQPYAYVADFVQEVALGADVDEVRGRGVDASTWEAVTELRDKLAQDEKLAWYVVVCGDTERHVPDPDEYDPTAGTAPGTGASSYANSSHGGDAGGRRRRRVPSGAASSEWTGGSRAASGATSRGSSTTGDRRSDRSSGRRSFREWWSSSKSSGLRKSRSFRNLVSRRASSPPPPPLPPLNQQLGQQGR